MNGNPLIELMIIEIFNKHFVKNTARKLILFNYCSHSDVNHYQNDVCLSVSSASFLTFVILNFVHIE